MKRILLSLILVCCSIGYVAAQNNDVHLRRLIECVNDSNFVCAAEQLPLVKEWPFLEDGKLDVHKGLAFWEYAEDELIHPNITDSLALYIATEAYQKSCYFREIDSLEEALQYLELEKNILEDLSLEQTKDYAISINDIGNIYYTLGNYQDARENFQKAADLMVSLVGPTAPEMAYIFSNLGAISDELGNRIEAEKYYKQSLQIIAQSYGEMSPKSIVVLINLGVLYFEILNYSEAESCYLKAMKICEKFPNEYIKEHAQAIDNLAILYASMGNARQAEELYTHALDIVEDAFGEQNLLYAQIIHHLGETYQDLGDYDRTLECYQTALDIRLKLLPKDHPKYVTTFLRVGNIYELQGDYTNAEMSYNTALYIDSIAYGTRHLKYADDLVELGKFYYNIKNYDVSQYCLSWALEIMRSNIGERYYNYAIVIHTLSLVFEGLRDYYKEYIYLSYYYELRKDQYVRSLDFLSERQREYYSTLFRDDFASMIPSLAYHYSPQERAISSFAYNNELFSKGLLLSSSTAIRRSVLESGDTTLIRQWDELTRLRQAIIALQAKSPTSPYITEYEQQAEVLEKEITRSSAAYRENMRQWNITWDSVRTELGPNQVAIEYMKAPLNEDSTMYCALLLRDTYSCPVLIPLFEEKEMKSLVHTQTDKSSLINTTYLYHKNGKKLSHLVWDKVKPYINEGEDIFFSPTGVLHQLAIENLPYDATHTMSDVYNMVRVSSTRELVLNKQPIPHQTATLYGDIDYSLQDTTIMLANAEKYRDLVEVSIVDLAGDTVRGSFAENLPGTKKEIESIKPILAKKHVAVTIYAQDTACEESFKALSGKKQNILHVATHGFYWPDNSIIKDPMDRCGLLFAGANTALIGQGKTLPPGVDDGILTAKEISNLDFRSTDIVVMSACETGLGEISGEGVFGLQRAFKMAGAQTILMSLWRVDDDATQLLMTAFYRHLSQGQSKRQAFRNAQQDVRNYTVTEERNSSVSSFDKFKKKGKTVTETVVTQKYSSPYFWAGFILLD